ncbi:MAG TPA: isopentenyl-diphosphate Delta-isomerase [Rickettsiales bacterium]|nr:isopentenyl-diphosphate Delta-isomerase [Rickettsiales bacterium]
MEKIILVDENDNKIGLMEKLEAHKKGLLHRAFSGFIFNDKNELLLQRRDFNKYHNGGLWSNTVCSHPRDNETNLDAICRRIFEEFGFKCENFKEVGHFIYEAKFPNGLIENEYDYIFIAKYDNQTINPNPVEICDYKWISKTDLQNEISNNPNNYTFWLKQILKMNIW